MLSDRHQFISNLHQLIDSIECDGDTLTALSQFEKATWESTKQHRFMFDNFCVKLIDLAALIPTLLKAFGLDAQEAEDYWSAVIKAATANIEQISQAIFNKKETLTPKKLTFHTERLETLTAKMLDQIAGMLKHLGFKKSEITFMTNIQQAERRRKAAERHQAGDLDQFIDNELANNWEEIATLIRSISSLQSSHFTIRDQDTKSSAPEVINSNKSSPTGSTEEQSYSPDDSSDSNSGEETTNPITTYLQTQVGETKDNNTLSDIESGIANLKHKTEHGKDNRLLRAMYAMDPIVTISFSPDDAWAFAQITEPSHQYYPYQHNGEGAPTVNYEVLSIPQITQYLFLLKNSQIVNNNGTLSVKHNAYAGELFWFYISSPAKQIYLLKLLQQYEQEAKQEETTVLSQHAILSRKISVGLGHVGSGARDSGPTIHIGLSSRAIAYQKIPGSNRYRKMWDSKMHLPKGQVTSGIPDRHAMPSLAKVDLQDQALNKQHIENVVWLIIEQEIESRAVEMLDRYHHHFKHSAWFQNHGHKLEFTLTRILIDLLSPVRFDDLAKRVTHAFGKEYNNDNKQMTDLLFQAVRGLREKYKDMVLPVPYRLPNGETKEYNFKILFGAELLPINGLRASNGVAGLLQIDTSADTTGSVLGLCHMAHELSLYADALSEPLKAYAQSADAPRQSEIPRASLIDRMTLFMEGMEHSATLSVDAVPKVLQNIAKQFMRFSATSDIKDIPIDALEKLNKTLCQVKEALTGLYETDPLHPIHHIVMRTEMFLQYLMLINGRYTFSSDYNRELMAAAYYGLSVCPEGVSSHCKSGHDRTGAYDNLHFLLPKLYFEQGRRLPDLSRQSNFASFVFAGELRSLLASNQTKSFSAEIFFDQYLDLLLYQMRPRGFSGNESGIKSLPSEGRLYTSAGAHSMGLVKAAKRKGVMHEFKRAKKGAKLHANKVKSHDHAACDLTVNVSNPFLTKTKSRTHHEAGGWYRFAAKKLFGLDEESINTIEQSEEDKARISELLTDLRASHTSFVSINLSSNTSLAEMVQAIREYWEQTRPIETRSTLVQFVPTDRPTYLTGEQKNAEKIAPLFPRSDTVHSDASVEMVGIKLDEYRMRQDSRTSEKNTNNRLYTSALSRTSTELARTFANENKQALIKRIDAAIEWSLQYHNLDTVNKSAVLKAAIVVLLATAATVFTYQFYGYKATPQVSFEEDWRSGYPGNNVYSFIIMGLFFYGISATVYWEELIIKTQIVKHHHIEATHDLKKEIGTIGNVDCVSLINQKIDLLLCSQRFDNNTINSVKKELLGMATPSAKIGILPDMLNPAEIYDFIKSCCFHPLAMCMNLSRHFIDDFVGNQLFPQRLELLFLPLIYAIWTMTWMLSELKYLSISATQEFCVEMSWALVPAAFGANETNESMTNPFILIKWLLRLVSAAKILGALPRKDSWNQREPGHAKLGESMVGAYQLSQLSRLALHQECSDKSSQKSSLHNQVEIPEHSTLSCFTERGFLVSIDGGREGFDGQLVQPSIH